MSYNPQLGNTEPLPLYYHDSQATKQWAEEEPHRALLENLRTDLLWKDHGPEHGASVTDAIYAVSRSIGDDLLFDAERPDIGGLLDISRYESAPRHFEHTGDEWAPGAEGFYNAKHRILGVDLKSLSERAKELQEITDANGEKLLNGSDGYLVAYLQAGAHEVGHSVLSGISGVAGSLDRGKDYFGATKRYLMNNPEESVTGHWQTDVSIHEERFAEGYANMVTERVLTLLGYAEERKQAVMQQLGFSHGVRTHQPGQHQLDHLDGLSATTSPSELVNAVNIPKNDNGEVVGGQTYSGALGYYLPLSKEEIADQIEDLTRSIRDKKDFDASPQDLEKWFEQVKRTQDPELKEQIQDLKRQRGDFVKAHEKAERKRVRHQRLGKGVLNSLKAKSEGAPVKAVQEADTSSVPEKQNRRHFFRRRRKHAAV